MLGEVSGDTQSMGLPLTKLRRRRQPVRTRRVRHRLARLPKDAQRRRLEDALELAKRNGFTTSRSEIFVGAVAVSAPYYDHRGSVVESIGLYGPSARVSEDKVLEFARLVVDAARKVSLLLGVQMPEQGSEANLSQADRSFDPAARGAHKLSRLRKK